VLASQDVAGVYNIIYRYLFDRRRDLPLPASFLLSKDGMIVKIYQGLCIRISCGKICSPSALLTPIRFGERFPLVELFTRRVPSQ